MGVWGFSKILSLTTIMAKPNFKTYYVLAILTGLFIGIATEDKYIGFLIAIALVLTLSGIKQRNRNREW